MVVVRCGVVVAAIGAVCCGDNNPAKPTPVALAISCPAPATTASADGGPVAVTFSSPGLSGGQAPVTTACTPASGSAFPLGTSNVTCTATDAARSAASCTFPVMVQRVPRLGISRILAFGDSITEGTFSTCDRVTPSMTFREWMLVLPKAANDSWNYPNVLQALLRSYFSAESPTVINRGVAGEQVASGVSRLPMELINHSPDVLLLQEGANDVGQRSPLGIARDLRSMLQLAKMRNVQVVLGTMLPEQGSPCHTLTPSSVPPINDAIRDMAASENVPLVDLYARFGDPPGGLIGVDGLHPSEAGYRVIAEAFFAELRQRFEK